MIIAIHGTQGAGKSSICDLLKGRNPNYTCIAIKDSFIQYANHIIDDLQKKTGTIATVEAHKQLSLAISTWGETYYDEQVWSTMTYDKIKSLASGDCILDGVRTKMNLDMLIQLSNEGQKVIFLRLLASEETRRKRVSAWRENGGYTEVLLEKPKVRPVNFYWHDINTENQKCVVEKQILELIFRK